MAERGMIFREITNKQGFPSRWKEITISTGNQKKVTDVKVADQAGGYVYHDSSHVDSAVRNRYICWRSSQSVLELVEFSLDVNLTGNSVRINLQGAPILPGLSIHEYRGDVIILVPTATSVHRFIFPHPNRLQRHGLEIPSVSIFCEASVKQLQDPGNMHNIQQVPHPPQGSIHTGAAWLTADAEAVFALALSTGSIVMVKLPVQGTVAQHELKQSSVMQRLWSGLVPSVIRGGQESGDISTSLCIHPLGGDTFIFSLCRDHKMRMWSCQNLDCVMATDMLGYLPDNLDLQRASIGGDGHRAKIAVGSSNQALYLGIYICLSDRCQFCIFEVIHEDNRHQLRHVTTVLGPQDELVDFAVTGSRLWTLWNTVKGDLVAKYAVIIGDVMGGGGWQDVVMSEAETTELDVPQHREPREAYIDHIFYPGRFSNESILRALMIYKRSLDTTQLLDMNIPIQALKAEVMSVVEHEIQTEASEYEMAGEDFCELQLTQWARFYSCCVQYHERMNKPIGIFASAENGIVFVVKKNSGSVLRPCHVIEELSLAPESLCSQALARTPEFSSLEDGQLNSVISLGRCLSLLRASLGEDVIYCLEQDLYHTQDLEQVAIRIVANLMQTGSEEERVSQSLLQLKLQLEGQRDIMVAIEALLSSMAVDSDSQDGYLLDNSVIDASQRLSASRLLSSSSAVEVMCGIMNQYAQTRLDLSRDLLILLIMLTYYGDQVNLPVDAANRIKCELISQCCQMVRSNYILKWASESLALPVSASAIDSNQRQLEALDLAEMSSGYYTPQARERPVTLLEVFLLSHGGQKLKDMLVQCDVLSDQPLHMWRHLAVPVLNNITKLLWPSSGCFVLPEFLMGQCMYSELQDYVRLTQDWCDWNPASRRFMLGQCYLNCSEPLKAVDCFLDAVHGIYTEDFLTRLLQVDPDNPGHLQVYYYLKVIRLFEQFCLPDLVVSLAKTAIQIAEDDDPNVPILWSKVFKHHLEMAHDEEAYRAMIANPDPSRRKDCLRQFLIVLCERSQLQTLVELPYKDQHIDLEDEVVNILESRARSIDLTKHSYYDLLYAFHVFRNNFRKAGSVMYEHGMRLGQEVGGLAGLQKQAKCYLAAMNSLRLVSDKYAWIVKPVPAMQVDNDNTTLKKRSVSGEEFEIPLKRQVVVVELSEIEKEYILIHARLELLKRDPEPSRTSGPTNSADETMGLLVNAGLYDRAINIGKLFNVSLDPVFEGLASRCVKLSENSSSHMCGDNDYTSQAWSWLQENDLEEAGTSRENSTSAEHSWRLLQRYLREHETTTTRYHRAITVRVLSQGFHLPDWFVASYKIHNAPELLRLYLDYDLLIEAANLTTEYVDAVMGKGKEYFGLKTFLNVNSASVWLPYTSIDHLLLALQKARITDPAYALRYRELDSKLNHYFDAVESVSRDKVAAGYRSKHSSNVLAAAAYS